MLSLLLVACMPPEAADTETPVNDPYDGVYLPNPPPADPLRGFSWVEQGVLAAMPFPRDLDALGAEGIVTLVSLTEILPNDEALESSGLESLHLPVEDFTAPTLQQMSTFVQTVEEGRLTNQPVGVHCAAGLGRSGTMSAAWFVYEGMSAEDALTRIREIRPGSVETLSQEESIAAFEAMIRP